MEKKGNPNLGPEPGHPEDKPRKGPEGSFVSQHAIFWEKHAPNMQNSTSSRQRMNAPTRYTGDKEKLTATRQKFMQNAVASSDTALSSASRLKADNGDEVAPKPIVRGRTDFNQLLQKFSGSESNSEKSDTDVGTANVSGIPRRRSLVKRQEAKEVISSSEESDTRRTPDRTQSLKLPSRLVDGLRPGISENKSLSSTTIPEAATSIVEKTSSFRSEFMNRKWSQRNTETSQATKEPSHLQTTTTSSTLTKTPMESKVEAMTTSTSSDTQHNGTSVKSLGLTSGISEVHGHLETPSLMQIKTQDLKSKSVDKNSSLSASSGADIKRNETIVSQKSMETARNLGEKSLGKPTSSGAATKHSDSVISEKYVDKPVTIRAKFLDKATSLGEKSVEKTTSHREKSVDKATNIGEKIVDKTTRLGEKSVEKTNSLGEKSVEKTTSLREKSVEKSTNIGEKPVEKTTSLPEKSVEKTTSLGERSVEKTTKIGVKYVEKTTSLGEKSVEKTTSFGEKSVEKTTSLGEKSVEKTTSLGEKSVEKTTSIGVKSTANTTSLDEKSIDRTMSLGEKSIDRTMSLGEKSIDRTTSLGEKTIDKPTSLGEKSIDRTMSLGEKSIDRTMSLGEKSIDRAMSLGEKPIDMLRSLGEKSIERTTSHGEKTIAKTTNLGETSVDKTTSPGEKSIDKTISISAKSVVKTPSLGEKSRVITTSLDEKSTIKTTSVGEKTIVKPMTLGDKSTVNTTTLGDKSTVNTTTLGDKSTVNTTTFGDKSTVNTTTLGEKSTVNTTTLGEKSTVNTTTLGEKSTVNTTTLGEKSTLNTTSLANKSMANTTTIGKKSAVNTNSLAEKSDDKTTSMSDVSICRSSATAIKHNETVDSEKSMVKTTGHEKSMIQTTDLDKKSTSTTSAILVKHNEPVVHEISVDKTTSLITSSDAGDKHDQTVTSDQPVSSNAVHTNSSATKHHRQELTDSNKPDASTLRVPPQARPRTSLERDTKSESNLPSTSTSGAASTITTKSFSTTLSSSVSSSEIKSLTASNETLSSNMSEVRRASSFKEVSVARTDSIERRKGILKRNTSLTKQDLAESTDLASFPIIDPQLAKILRQRKQMVGDVNDKEEAEERKDEMSNLARRPKGLTAAEEIEQTLRYSQQKAVQRGLNPEEDEGLKRLSVAERIYSMQTKIEEEKFPVVTPKSRSGLSTPRSRQRSGVITPTIQKSSDELLQQASMSSSVTTSVDTAIPSSSISNIIPTTKSREQQPGSETTAVSGSQLIEKLSKIAKDTEKYEQRRHRFQHRARNDRRHQTQPVTYDEIQAADSLETVSAFRALVRKQTSINAFDQFKAENSYATKQQLANSGKRTEFPQHLVPPPRLPRRNRKLRHRTLPVTADELNAVPEHQMLVTDSDWFKLDEFDKRDSKADSGILSGSEADSLYHSESLRSLSLDMDLSENDPSRLSVTDKASIFRSMEERTKAERDKEKSASGAKRYINRKKRERSQTMPITDEEVKTASEIGSGGSCSISDSKRAVTVSLHQPEVVNRSRSASVTEDGDKEEADDDLVKLSLTEKVKLFSQPREAEKQPVKAEVAVVRRKTRKVASRFNTQPVTNEEVEKAAAFSRISPLAMSMVKPPDPDILKGLPLKDQRELMAQHAEMFLSQTSLRSRSGSNASQSQPSSRRASVTLDEGEVKTREGEEESDKNDKKGILKDKCASAKDLHDVKSILKTDPIKAKSESEVHSILKMEVKNILETSFASAEPRGILKKTRSEDIGGVECGEDIKGILKHIDNEEEENCIKPRSRSNSQPLGILKIENACQSTDHAVEIRSILKAPSQDNVHDPPVMKSAMRRESIESDTSVPAAAVLKSALRTRNKNSLENEDSHVEETLTPDGSNAGHDCDLNSNNSHKHVSLTVTASTERMDHFSGTSTNSKHVSATTATSKSLGSVDVQTYSTTSSMVATTTSSSLSCLQVPEGSEERSGQSASDDGESSSGEILDGTPRTSKLKRKSRFSDRAAKSERYKTQPPELTETAAATSALGDSTPRRKYKYEGRHRTQPVTPNEMREAEAITPVADLTRTPGGSIADRLNQLKSSGEEEWKKRVGKKEEVLASPDIIKLREKTGALENRPCSIADRLNELETSMTTWKERVEESDAKQFTVAGRLPHGPTESPLCSKLKNLPRKDEPSSKNSSPLSSPVTPTKDFIAKIPLPKDIVQDTSVIVESVNKAASGEWFGDEAEEKREPVKVEVPDMGEEIENFFAVKPIEEITDKVEMEVDDFNNIFIEAEMILSTVRKVRPNRKIRPSSQNPLKTMSQKIEIRQEYTEVMYGTAEKELKRVKKEGLAKEAGFAQAALAGLASKENFKQVELRRTDSGSSVHGQALDPFKEVMLLHVKGRRSVQTRLVEPHARSINEGDCYVLVTGDKVIHWEGRFANVIEKAKASEVASYIQQKKDLGCKKANEVLTVFQDKDHLGAGKPFWAALEGEKQFQACGPEAEDELYESSVVKCNMVYKLVGNALQPYEEYWGAIPKYEMLKKNEVIIFDFGTEFYVWQGKAVSMEQRKLGLKLAKQLYEKGYDYTESPINPLSPLRVEESGGLPLSSSTRPNWAIFGKVNQNMETILFREKFADWPDSSRLIGCKGHGPSETVSKELLEMKPFDAKRMIPCNTTPVNLKLEGANLGRGVKWSEDMQGFVKEQDIITLDVIAWHVLEYAHYKLPELSHGQFHDGDTYVVRWQYMVANANLRSLKGSAARNSLTGRERCAYFFWQGNQSTINEKGASALMTVELDEERGPQVRVLQGKEPPCFLNLFGGKMILHIGKREDPTTNSQGSWRLYCLRGDYENEIYLLEIPVSVKHLRSRSSMVLLNVKTGIVYVWHGSKSPKHVRELCLTAVSRLKEKTPLEVGLHEKATITVVEVEEGEEKREIWAALDKPDRSIYHSLLTDPRSYNHTIRLFHMSSVNLVFEVHEQLNPAQVPDLVTPFPFLQSDLYRATQPGLFLIDNDREVYLWQGWWPVGSHDTENVHTGSAIARFNLDRRLAMETTLHYCREKNPTKPPIAYLVCAGVEPVCFTSLFPYWEDDIIVKDIASEEGKPLGYMEPVSDILHRLTKTRYTLAELQERPLPEGVDPLKLETYLFDADFEEILEMSRDEFYAQPHWKQIDLKKQVGLF